MKTIQLIVIHCILVISFFSHAQEVNEGRFSDKVENGLQTQHSFKNNDFVQITLVKIPLPKNPKDIFTTSTSIEHVDIDDVSNSCITAKNNVCEDSSYLNINKGTCDIGTDEEDCKK